MDTGRMNEKVGEEDDWGREDGGLLNGSREDGQLICANWLSPRSGGS